MVTSASTPLPMVPVIKIEDDAEEKVCEKKPEALPAPFIPAAPRKFLTKAPKKLVVKFKNPPIVIHDEPNEDVPQASTSKVAEEADEAIVVDEEEKPPEDVAEKEDVPEVQEDINESPEEQQENEKTEEIIDCEDTPEKEDEVVVQEATVVEETTDDVIVVEDTEPPVVVEIKQECTQATEESSVPECEEVVTAPIQEIIKTECQPIEIQETDSFTIEEIEVEEEKNDVKIFPSCSSSSSSSSAGTSASSSSASSSSSAGTNRGEFAAPNSQGFFEEAAGPSRFDYGFTEFLGYNESEGEMFSNDRSVRFSPMGMMNEDLSWEQYTQLESNQNSYVDLDTCRTHSMGVSRAPSADSLNIRTDEKMPAKGEISEQESNGDIDGLWNIPVYPNSDAVPRFSSSYDMSVARESWSLSSDQNNQQDTSEIATHIIPKFTSLTAENDADQKSLVPLLGELENTSTFKKITKKIITKPPGRILKYPCSMCSRSFRLYRQRKYHVLNEHQELLAAQKRKKASAKIKLEPPAATITTTDASVSQQEEPNYPTSAFFIDFNIKQLKEKLSFSVEMQNLVMTFRTKRLYFCMTCKGQFAKIRDYDKHLSIHPSECGTCGKMFKSWKSLLNHLKRHLGINEYTCRPCNKQFSTRQSLVEHERMHTGETPIKCPLCPRTFRRQSNLLQHRNNHHMKMRPRLKDYLCHCGEVFHTKAKFLWHKETHEKIPKGCPFCRERFIHRNSLSRHIRLAHAEKYIEIKKETVACHICHKHYLKTSIKTHLMIHTEQVNFECSICNKTFSTKWNLKMHKWIHASRTAMPFKCPTCPKAFIRQSDLQDHLNRHKSIKPFTCDYCGCQFGRKYNWLRHTREHITDKQHTCKICGKSFHRAYYLKEHSRSHTNERPYECIICGKTSATKTNHNKHVKIHHARDPLTAEG
uniref:C2H2-type domain-containing protein n=1 Tax=Nyssomyia neivai TaxID=330878 RepID=A0A1L8DIS3_9DIPT